MSPRPDNSRPGDLDWPTARTVADLGELTARFLLGGYPESPTHVGPPDPETASIRDRLVLVNRAGLVTEGSQPGVIDEYGSSRAFVDGFCSLAVCDTVEQACTRAGLVALVRRPRRPRVPAAWPRCRYPAIPVGVDPAGRTCTTVGGFIPTSWLTSFYPRAARTARLAAWDVTVFDPEWGRADLLWTTLTGALAGAARELDGGS
jgi:hypothetical protein